MSGALLTCFGYVLIPQLADATDKRQLLRGVFPALFWCVCGVVVAGVLASPALVRWSAPHLRADKMLLAVRVEQVFWLAAGASGLSSFFSAILQDNKVFVLPAASGLLIRFGMLAVLLIAVAPNVVWLAWGYLAGALLQAALLAWPLRHRLYWGRPSWGQASRRFFQRLLPVLFSILPTTLVPMMDAYWAAGLPDGSLSFVGYDFRLTVTVVTVLVSAVTGVIFPYLCDQARNRGERQFRRLLFFALGLEFVLIGPAIAVAVVWRHAIIRILFQRGVFTAASTAAVAGLLPLYLIGMFGMATWIVVSGALYARQWYRAMGVLGLAFSIAYFVIEGALLPHWGYRACGLAFASCWLGSAAAALAMLRRSLAEPVPTLSAAAA